MEVILYIDLLGTRAHWQRGGIDTAVLRLDRFARFMIGAARPDIAGISSGGIETDSAAFVCNSPLVAVRIAQRAFMRAFKSSASDPIDRLWLRGAVVPAASSQLRSDRPAFGSAKAISIVKYTREFFDAVSIEKSGFKGMRLLVRDTLVDAELKQSVKFVHGANALIPLKRLRHSGYPAGPTTDLRDFLWMFESTDRRIWEDTVILMSRRLRLAAANPDEFGQAAATQVLFHEADALIRSVWSRAKRNRAVTADPAIVESQVKPGIK